MFSRGKQLVALSLKRRGRDGNIRDGNIDEKCDENNNTMFDSDESLDCDDDVRDPDFVPKRKKKKPEVVNKIIQNVTKSSQSVSLTNLTCDETLSSDLSYPSFDEETDSEGPNACTLPTKVIEPNERVPNQRQSLHQAITYCVTETQRAVDSIDESTAEKRDIVSEQHEVLLHDEHQIADHEEVVEGIENERDELRKKIESSTNVTKLKNKLLRMTGMQYKGVKKDDQGRKHYSKDRGERILTASKCSKRCAKKAGGRLCTEIDSRTRQEIFKMFWQGMDWNQKKVYVLSLVDKCEVKRRTKVVFASEGSRRKVSYKYYLNAHDQRVLVCREMFLSTLGVNEKMVYQWIQDSESGVPSNVNFKGLPDTSGRGGKTSQALDHARQYLVDLPKMPSHYCRVSTSKQYLEPLFGTIKELHTEYTRKLTEDSKPVLKITQFTKLFHDMNISLYRPKKDLCDTCCGYEAKSVPESEYSKHIQRKEEARTSKARDKDIALREKHVKVLTVDLQSLLTCPKLNASSLYYKMKLSCHNYTVYDLATRNVLCYFWHECDGELTANVFTSCIIDYLSSIDLQVINHVIIYSDGCGYQNRNVVLSNALLQFACDKRITIEQKFLERGHTQMEVDSVHGTIERRVKGRPVYVPEQYVENIRNARKGIPYQVKYIDFTFFKDYSKSGKYSSIRPGTGVGSETVSDIRLLKYTSEKVIQYKTNYASEYRDLPEPRKTSVDSDVESLYAKSLNLKKTKFTHLQQLKDVIPKDYHGFYDNLPHC